MNATSEALKVVDNRHPIPVCLRVSFHEYERRAPDGEPLIAIRLVVDGDQGELMDGEPWLTATRSTPELDGMPRQRVAVADYGSEEGIAKVLIAGGILNPEKVSVLPAGFSSLVVYDLTPEAYAAAQKAIAGRRPAAPKR